MTPRLLRVAVVLAAFLLGCCGVAQAAPSSTATPAFWAAGPVSSMVTSGSTVYVAGNFDYAGPATGDFAPIDPVTGFGRVPKGWPTLTGGAVYATASDGAGGWYVGGSFTAPQTRLVHIRADGTLDPNFRVTIPSGQVNAIAVVGSTVYAGGTFTSVGGQARSKLAAVNAADGSLTDWNPISSSTVSTLAVSGTTLYVGGQFASMGSPAVSRNRLAAFDTTTGALTDWNPNAGGTVSALAVSGSTLYAGGQFTNMGSGTGRKYLAAFDTTTGALTDWNPSAGSQVSTLAVSGSTLYVGGQFTTMGYAPPYTTRNRLAAFDTTTGTLTSWDPNASNNTVNTLAVSGSTVYAGGTFTTVGGVAHNRLAAIGTDGTVKAWAPALTSPVFTLAADDTTVYSGGSYASAGGVKRNGVAAFDTTTGMATSWDAGVNFNGIVSALALDGSTLYLGGSFTTVGGQSRTNLAAVRTTDGGVTGWNPVPDSNVSALAVNGSTLVVGGPFTEMNWVSRQSLAAVKLSDGTTTSWDPGTDGSVRALAADGSTVYVAGGFAHAGGLSRNGVAAIGADGQALPAWDAHLTGGDPSVNALSLAGDRLYLGGSFDGAGAMPSARLAAVHTADGSVVTTDFTANGPVSGVLAAGSTIYAAGTFTNIGGQSRAGVAALTPAGAVAAWSPNVGEHAGPLAMDAAGNVYVGGDFTSVDGSPRLGFAQYVNSADPVTPTTPTVTPAAPAWVPEPSVPAPAPAPAPEPAAAAPVVPSAPEVPADHVVQDGLRDVTDVRMTSRSVRFTQDVVAPGALRWTLEVRIGERTVRLASGRRTVTAAGEVADTLALDARDRALLRKYPHARLVLASTLKLDNGRVLKATKKLERA
jgi:trimeric autotransporter adhesin